MLDIFKENNTIAYMASTYRNLLILRYIVGLRARKDFRTENIHFRCQILNYELSIFLTLSPLILLMCKVIVESFYFMEDKCGLREVEQVSQHFTNVSHQTWSGPNPFIACC